MPLGWLFTLTPPEPASLCCPVKALRLSQILQVVLGEGGYRSTLKLPHGRQVVGPSLTLILGANSLALLPLGSVRQGAFPSVPAGGGQGELSHTQDPVSSSPD